MNKAMGVALALSAGLAVSPLLISSALAQGAKGFRVLSDQKVAGFAYPEAVAYDPNERVLYVSQFGSELKPAEKDGKGRISKVLLSGRIVDEQFLPGPGGTLHKPKGMWVKGDRLWVSDIDAVWVFDLKTRRGTMAEVPGIKFANDVAVMGNALYVSDNRNDQLYRVEPADFLDRKGGPKTTLVFSGKSVYPNGLYPGRDGSLLIVGFQSPQQPRGIYSLSANGEVKPLSKDIGRLDGIYPLGDGTLLATDWGSGALIAWDAKTGVQTLASGFKGPADFCVVPDAKGFLVVVPDLVLSELRIIRLAR